MSNTKVRLPFLADGMVSKWWNEYQDVVEVVGVDDAFVAKTSGGDVDAEPYLDSRNTKGYGTCRGFVMTDVLVKGLRRGSIATG